MGTLNRALDGRQLNTRRIKWFFPKGKLGRFYFSSRSRLDGWGFDLGSSLSQPVQQRVNGLGEVHTGGLEIRGIRVW